MNQTKTRNIPSEGATLRTDFVPNRGRVRERAACAWLVSYKETTVSLYYDSGSRNYLVALSCLVSFCDILRVRWKTKNYRKTMMNK